MKENLKNLDALALLVQSSTQNPSWNLIAIWLQKCRNYSPNQIDS